MLQLRCVLVGDPCVGKTSLIVAYTRNGFCEHYYPTAFDNYSVTVCVDGTPLRLELCDTAGRSEFDSIRPLSYADASVFLLCFDVARLSTLSSATQRWLPEIRALAPSAPILLVGTQSDRRLSSRRGETVEPAVMTQLASRLQMNLMECSAVTQQNLKEVFDLAILHALCHQRRLAQHPTNTSNKPVTTGDKVEKEKRQQTTDRKSVV